MSDTHRYAITVGAVRIGAFLMCAFLLVNEYDEIQLSELMHCISLSLIHHCREHLSMWRG